MGSRQGDIERLYCSNEWETARQILDQYQIRYVYVGSLERQTYQPGIETCPNGLVDAKFTQYLTPVFQSGQATIYEYSNPNNSRTPSD